MINRILTDEEVIQLKYHLERYNNIVLTCHLSPDGDAVGSTLGMKHLLETMGKTVHVITPDMVPKSLLFLPGAKDIIAYSKYTDLSNRLVNNSQLIICLDFNTPKRLDNLAPAITEAKAKKILIDHHIGDERFCDLTISYDKMSSTCELVFRAILGMGMYQQVNRKCAECLYAGMMTDTGNFTYNSNDPDIYNIVAMLLKKGINKDRIYSLAINTSSTDRLRLIGYSLSQKMEVYTDCGAALIILTKDELLQYNYKKGDTESLVNMPLQIPEVYWSVFMREDAEYVKISIRSKGEFAVNTICEKHFNGGGHKNAAGGEFYGTVEDAKAEFKKIIEEVKSMQETNENLN